MWAWVGVYGRECVGVGSCLSLFHTLSNTHSQYGGCEAGGHRVKSSILSVLTPHRRGACMPACRPAPSSCSSVSIRFTLPPRPLHAPPHGACSLCVAALLPRVRLLNGRAAAPSTVLLLRRLECDGRGVCAPTLPILACPQRWPGCDARGILPRPGCRQQPPSRWPHLS